MGICDSSSPNEIINSESTQDDFLSNNYSARKKNIIKNNKLILKQNNGFILPANIAKRENVKKYYHIKQKVLGEGTSGKVCLGEKKGVQYALKMINKDKIKTKSFQRFILEAEISLQLKHENIITYYEIYEDSDYITYIMDLAEGGDLFDFIIGCPLGHLPADIVITLSLQIFSVVDYLHSVKGIMHRDLKPENFMIKIDVDNKPIIKLIDFGFATYIPKNGEKLHEFLGTREYVAPEIVQEKGYTEKVDEWSLGVIFYNMLTGFEPFRGNTPSELRDSVLFSTIQFDKIEDVDLRELCEKLLNRFVSRRITCNEALFEINKIKIERDNYSKGIKRLNKKTSSEILKKENQEVIQFMSYWDKITRSVDFS
jgi:serine/threonine protein kinase